MKNVFFSKTLKKEPNLFDAMLELWTSPVETVRKEVKYENQYWWNRQGYKTFDWSRDHGRGGLLQKLDGFGWA